MIPETAQPVQDEKVLKWTFTPTKDNTGSAKMTHWFSECGRYRVSRVVSGSNDNKVQFAACFKTPKGQWDVVEAKFRGSEGYGPIYYPSLLKAAEAIEDFHGVNCRVLGVSSNKTELLKSALFGGHFKD